MTIDKNQQFENDTMVKVLFNQVGEDGELEVETLWAQLIDDNLAKIDNIPLVVFGVSKGDVIKISYEDKEQRYVFQEVEQRGDHSTYRVVFREQSEVVKQKWLEKIKEIGCFYEGISSNWVAIDVPNTVDSKKINELFDDGLANSVWYVEEGYIVS